MKNFLVLLTLLLTFNSFAKGSRPTAEQIEAAEAKLLDSYEQTQAWFNGLTFDEKEVLRLKIEKKVTKALRKKKVQKKLAKAKKSLMFCLEAGAGVVAAVNTSICRYKGQWATIQSFSIGYSLYAHAGFLVIFNPILNNRIHFFGYSAGFWLLAGGRYQAIHTASEDSITHGITIGPGLGVDFSSWQFTFMGYL